MFNKQWKLFWLEIKIKCLGGSVCLKSLQFNNVKCTDEERGEQLRLVWLPEFTNIFYNSENKLLTELSFIYAFPECLWDFINKKIKNFGYLTKHVVKLKQRMKLAIRSQPVLITYLYRVSREEWA